MNSKPVLSYRKVEVNGKIKWIKIDGLGQKKKDRLVARIKNALEHLKD